MRRIPTSKAAYVLASIFCSLPVARYFTETLKYTLREKLYVRVERPGPPPGLLSTEPDDFAYALPSKSKLVHTSPLKVGHH